MIPPRGCRHWTVGKFDSTYGPAYWGRPVATQQGPVGLMWRWGQLEVGPQVGRRNIPRLHQSTHYRRCAGIVHTERWPRLCAHGSGGRRAVRDGEGRGRRSGLGARQDGRGSGRGGAEHGIRPRGVQGLRPRAAVAVPSALQPIGGRGPTSPTTPPDPHSCGE